MIGHALLALGLYSKGLFALQQNALYWAVRDNHKILRRTQKQVNSRSTLSLVSRVDSGSHAEGISRVVIQVELVSSRLKSIQRER